MLARIVPAVLVLVAALPSAAVPAAADPSLTLYTHDLGYVRETRTLDISGGRDTVAITGIPERIDFSSARLAPADATVRITRLAYRYDVATGDALIQNAKGRRVRITSRGERVTEGVLVGTEGGFLVVRGDDGALVAIAREALETVRLTDPPASVATRPALVAGVEGGKRGRTEAELSYLTGGLSWSAEHTLVRRGENAGTWTTNVTVDNQTGVTWENANVKLVAGEPRRAAAPPMPVLRGMATAQMDVTAGKMTEESFADYHLYALGRPATIRDREQQSLTMHEPRDVKLTPRYLYRGGDPRGVTSQILVKNEKPAGLGMPLPGGRVRFYEADASGSVQFTGETTIGHTAEGETLTLDVGQAFDLVAERRETASRRISDRERESSVEIKLRNRKKSAVTIVVQEGVGGDFDVTQSSITPRKKDAHTLEFDVPVPAGKEVALTYTVRVRY